MSLGDDTYRLYGLTVACDRELSFWPGGDAPDLAISEGEVPDPDTLIHDLPDPGGEGRLRIWTTPAPILEYDGWRFLLDESRIIYQSTDTHRSPFDLVLERVVIPLHRLEHGPNLVAFHGAAVVIDESAYLFIGPSGAGKSTTARLLAQSAGRLATDDLAVVDASMMQLMPGAHGVRSFDPVPGAEPVELYPGSRKHWYSLDGPPPPETALRAIVRLERRDAWHLERVGGARAGVTLLEHTFDLQNPPVPWRERRMKNVMAVARALPLIQCTYPEDSGAPAHAEELFARVTNLLEQS